MARKINLSLAGVALSGAYVIVKSITVDRLTGEVSATFAGFQNQNARKALSDLLDKIKAARSDVSVAQKALDEAVVAANANTKTSHGRPLSVTESNYAAMLEPRLSACRASCRSETEINAGRNRRGDLRGC